MKTSDFLGGGGVGLYLAAGNVLFPGINTGTQIGQINNAVNVSNVNISGGTLTTVMSANVPAGENMLIKKLSLSNLTTTAADLTIEVEIDGVVVGTATMTSSAAGNVYIFGHNDSGTQQNVTNVLQDILVRSNITLRARKTPATAAGAALTYVKLKKG